MSIFRAPTYGRRLRGGRAMGDVAVASDPVAALAEQVNRFGPGAPSAYQFATTRFLDSGNLSPALALTALTIYQRRATDAYSQIADSGSLALLDAANHAFAAPVPFVMTHLADVTSVIRSFADMLGLPGGATETLIPGLDSTTLAMLAVGAVALWWMVK